MEKNLLLIPTIRSLYNQVGESIMRQQISKRKQKNMDNIHPRNNESAKESDKNLSKLENFFDNVTADKAAHKAPDSISLLYEQIISNLQSETLLLWSPRISTSMENFVFEEPTHWLFTSPTNQAWQQWFFLFRQ